MSKKANTETTEKKGLHPRNKHRNGYDFRALSECLPKLKSFISINKFQKETIDFSDPKAVKALNKALLKYHYGIEIWDVPKGYLCPPIPGRADYIHHMADLLNESKTGKKKTGKSITILDVGTGANCVYPLIGHKEYGWHFVGSESDRVAIKSANAMVEANQLSKAIECRFQADSAFIFKGIIKRNEYFDLTICNPPFHNSKESAKQNTERKWKNLGKEKSGKDFLNFGGKNSELFYSGGEKGFIVKMIKESTQYKNSVGWFTTLVSKKSNLPSIYNVLNDKQAKEVKTIEMSQGQKVSRVVAWRF